VLYSDLSLPLLAKAFKRILILLGFAGYTCFTASDDLYKNSSCFGIGGRRQEVQSELESFNMFNQWQWRLFSLLSLP
jgi:hypothetical protein